MDVPPDTGVGVPNRDVAQRLDVVEARLIDLAARLDALTDSLPSVVETAVAEQVRAMSGELRRTVSQLGRLLVRDLGRLSQILAEHRDTILAEVRGPAPPSSPPEPPVAAPADLEEATEDVEADTAEDTGAADADEEDGDRSWLRRRRAH